MANIKLKYCSKIFKKIHKIDALMNMIPFTIIPFFLSLYAGDW